MKSLVIGMGIGRLYKTVLTDIGHEVVTVDINPAANADYSDYESAYNHHKHFDTVHICTPNYLHLVTACEVAAKGAKIVFIEKPGVENHRQWKKMVQDFPLTRFLMVKNNQYRDEIHNFRDLAAQSESVKIIWNNFNRIPRPGTWFTTKELAFGGVSRDLIPHMLSYYCALTNYKFGIKLFGKADQKWELHEINSSDYGPVKKDGVYNVDDVCELEYKNNSTKYILTANWRTLKPSDISISFNLNSGTIRHELGLCPESAYKKMILTALDNLDNEIFWNDQFEQDVWIHQQLEQL